MAIATDDYSKLKLARPFAINAGNYYYDYDIEDTAKNHKYCDRFATLQELIEAYNKSRGYDFIELEYTDPNNRTYNISIFDAVIMMRNNNHA